MTEQDERNIRVVRLMYSGDEAERAQIAPNIVWHVPGHNPVSGEYRGFDEYTHLLPARMAPLSRWDFELEDVMVNGDHVVATFSVKGERKGKQVALRGAHIMRLNAAGQIVEGWGFTKDQDALDDFFSA
ncbi:MAG: nuclear transport factor 2 family protein [Anaerolineae bacterium]|uniref:nuclear transport factor 2 family protein n=1 Tax=Promineifilum sp. TaxID=2664178 RepID=UPI001DD7C707|nr:nuclear transport factor 2 family protein [Anaerolineales bacterium]MCB8934477.1 nuclear transport factor 2 family protein [Promineifilum sp.]MCO5179953.1 nuclear transport factor 2 family protein [Promineifilum sp.]MCW5847113.1 nuclear transport factor 2 family protein [Anaerolineae bacterium]